MERTVDSVKVWFWERDSPSVLDEVVNGFDSIDTDNWVRPFLPFTGMVY